MARFEKFTLKSQEAVQTAQDLAGKLHHQQIESEHLLVALVEQPDGVVIPILKKLGYWYSINSKNNVGLGDPPFKFNE